MIISEQKKVIMQNDSAELETLYNQLDNTIDREAKSFILQNIAMIENNIIYS